MDKIILARTLVGEPREYWEFVINDKPLPEYFGEVYESWQNAKPLISDSLIGVLNHTDSLGGQTLRIMALLRKEITVEECHQYLPRTQDWSLSDITELLKDDLNSEDVMLYCCSACGDRQCCGIAVKVKLKEDSFVWSFDKNNFLEFRFNPKEYRQVFNSYLEELSKSSSDNII